MKIKICLVMTSMILSQTAQASDIKVVSGRCKLEISGEIIELRNLAPSLHYGLFAEGSSKEGFRIYLANTSEDSISINIQAGAHGSYSVIPRANNNMTRIQTGTLVNRGSNQASEWLSCDLQII
jgi:hypothetical protein